MGQKNYILSVFFLMFISCGQMNTMFAPDGVYSVSARTGQYTLDECAVVRSNTPIHPYFIKAVDDDPDIRKLIVFLQTPGGEVVGKKVTYIIDPDKGVSLPESGKTDSAFSADPGFTGDSGSAFTDGPSFTEDPAFEDDSGFPEGSAATGDPAFPDGSGLDGFAPADDPDSAGGSGFPDDSGSAGLWDGTPEESGENGGIYFFFKRDTITGQSSQYDEDAIYVKNLSGILPPLLLPPDIAAGQYILVFQVIGEKGVLYRT
jgi:hypothetical protein